MSVKEIEDAILALDPGEQTRLMAWMEENYGPRADEDLSPEWRAEIDRRMAEVESGEVEPIPHDEAMASIRARMEEGRRARAKDRKKEAC